MNPLEQYAILGRSGAPGEGFGSGSQRGNSFLLVACLGEAVVLDESDDAVLVDDDRKPLGEPDGLVPGAVRFATSPFMSASRLCLRPSFSLNDLVRPGAVAADAKDLRALILKPEKSSRISHISFVQMGEKSSG